MARSARGALIAGNWKMHTTSREARALAQRVAWGAPVRDGIDLLICPPYTGLWTARAALSGTQVALGAQDVHFETHGAFTSAVSAGMLVDAGCTYVIVGHSERRTLMGDSDEVVARKTRAALEAKLMPIVCVGELLAERESGATEDVLKRQIAAVFDGLAVEADRVVIAYEPVWAIGTGKTATPQMAQDAHAFIRGEARRLCGEAFASRVRILYGGSVKPDNAQILMSQEDVDGVLVGGASLEAEGFLAIARGAIDAGK